MPQIKNDGTVDLVAPVDHLGRAKKSAEGGGPGRGSKHILGLQTNRGVAIAGFVIAH